LAVICDANKEYFWRFQLQPEARHLDAPTVAMKPVYALTTNVPEMFACFDMG